MKSIRGTMSKTKRTCQDDPWVNEVNDPITPNSDVDKTLIDNYILNRIKSQEDVARQLMLINATLLGIFIAFSKDNISVTVIKENIRYLMSLSLSPSLINLENSYTFAFLTTIIVLVPIFCWMISLFLANNILISGNDSEEQLTANRASERLKQLSQKKDKSMKQSYRFMFSGLFLVVLFFSFTYFYSIGYNVLGGEVISLVNNGNSLVILGEYEKAIKLYDEAIDINPKLEKAWTGKGNALSNLDKYDDAISAYENAIKINKNYPLAWYAEGNALSSKCMYSEALKYFNKTLEIDPNNLDAWNSKGVDLNNLGLHSEAIQWFDYAIYNKTIPDNIALAYLWINKGEALEDLDKYDESIEAYNEAIDVFPNYTRAWSDKARVLSLQGKYDESRKAIDRVIEYSPQIVNTFNKEGLILYRYGRYDKAIKTFDDSIRINPLNATIWNYKGETLYCLVKYNESILAYNKAIGLDPKYALAWYNKGVALKALGKTNKADEAFAKAKELGYTS